MLLIKEIYDKEKIGDLVSSVTFFFAVRKNPKIQAIATALARDPEGSSRIPKESF